jgi:hypothetical protein
MTKWVMDSKREPDMTLIGCLTQGPPSIARYIADNYPGARVVKWQCQTGEGTLADKPDM